MMDIDLNNAIIIAVGEEKLPIVLSKAKELVRKLEMKMSNPKKNVIASRHILVVDFACRILELSYDYSKLMSLVSISQKSYQECFIYCKNLLELKWNVPAAIELLAIHFGQQFKNPTLKIYDEYHEKYVSKQLKTIQDQISSSASAYYAAAFYIAAKDVNINLDKSKIIQIAEVDGNLFKSCVDSICNICGKRNLFSSQNNESTVNKTKNRQILQLQQQNTQNRQTQDNRTSAHNPKLKSLNQENIQPNDSNTFEKINENSIQPILSKLKFEKVDKSEIINKQIRALGIVPSSELEQKKKDDQDEERARAEKIEREREQFLAFKKESLAKRRRLETAIDIDNT